VHEYALARTVVGRAEAEARARGARAVRAVGVSVGALSGVEPELLAAAYELCRGGTLCAAAPLDVTRIEAAWGCSACGRRIAQGSVLRCPDCGAAARLLGGDELLLERIELEVA
jgi:hydrogenase nickel incorporation protein HypA/HybF